MSAPDPYSAIDLSSLLDRLVTSVETEFLEDGHASASVVEALAEAEQFDRAIRIMEGIREEHWQAEAAGYITEALARAGRVDEAEQVRHRTFPGVSRTYASLFHARMVQGLIGAGRLQEAVQRLDRFSPETIPSYWQLYPRLLCLDALLRADDREGAEQLLQAIRRGANQEEWCLGDAWMALGLNAWGDREAALRHANRAEIEADDDALPWVLGVYEALGEAEAAARVRARWEGRLERSNSDTCLFLMARAMANLRRYGDALRFASQIRDEGMVAKVYACIAYMMFTSGDHGLFEETFGNAFSASDALGGHDRIHALADVAIVMAWVQRLGINVSCATPILRASLAIAKAP